MRLLNYLIELPKQEGIGEAFHLDMEHFFRSIYSPEEMRRMRAFDRSHPNKYWEKFGEQESSGARSQNPPRATSSTPRK